jgi:hypothetical protein
MRFVPNRYSNRGGGTFSGYFRDCSQIRRHLHIGDISGIQGH